MAGVMVGFIKSLTGKRLTNAEEIQRNLRHQLRRFHVGHVPGVRHEHRMSQLRLLAINAVICRKSGVSNSPTNASAGIFSSAGRWAAGG